MSGFSFSLPHLKFSANENGLGDEVAVDSNIFCLLGMSQTRG